MPTSGSPGSGMRWTDRLALTAGAQETAVDAEQAPRPPSADAEGTDRALEQLRDALEGAGELAIDERLELLRGAEATIAGALEGLDGL